MKSTKIKNNITFKAGALLLNKREINQDDEAMVKTVKAVSEPMATQNNPIALALANTEFLESIHNQLPTAMLNVLRIDVPDGVKLQVPTGDFGTSNVNYVLEGEPIPVIAGKFSSQPIEAKKISAITVFSEELIRKTTTNTMSRIIENMVRVDMIKAISTAMLSADAISTKAPAGILNGITGVAKTADKVVEDIGKALDKITVESGVIIAKPSSILKIQSAMNGADIKGFELVPNVNAGDNVVIIGDNSLVIGGSDKISMELSNETTLVMSDPAKTVGDEITTPTTDVKSLYQDGLVALRSTLVADWAVVNADNVQLLTGTAW